MPCRACKGTGQVPDDEALELAERDIVAAEAEQERRSEARLFASDDDAADFPRELKCQRRLAAGGRPCDKHSPDIRPKIHVSRRHADLQSRRPRAR